LFLSVCRDPDNLLDPDKRNRDPYTQPPHPRNRVTEPPSSSCGPDAAFSSALRHASVSGRLRNCKSGKAQLPPHTLPLLTRPPVCRYLFESATHGLLHTDGRGLLRGWKESSRKSPGRATHLLEGRWGPAEGRAGFLPTDPRRRPRLPADSAWLESSGWRLCRPPATTIGRHPSRGMSIYTGTWAGPAPPDYGAPAARLVASGH
jgi:hypothetical protein